jgi:hypothetical protein
MEVNILLVIGWQMLSNPKVTHQQVDGSIQELSGLGDVYGY